MESLSVEPGEEEVAGWGRHPVGRGRVERPERLALPAGGRPLVPRGLGRAYGDAALPSNPGGLVLETTRADRIHSFEPATGRLHCEAGLSLAEILRVFVPRGWFPPVTPGTKFVTVGACVACDVHGKNHHRDGSFGSFVDRVTLCTADGRLVECGPDRERELFLATLGGMGLTGLIVDVTLRLRRVESPWIVLETQGMASLDAMLEGLRLSATALALHGGLDRLPRPGRRRSDAASSCAAATPPRSRPAPGGPARALPLRVPFDAPEWLLNPLFMRWLQPALRVEPRDRAPAPRGRATTRSSTRSTRSGSGTDSTAAGASSSTSACCRARRGPGRWRSCSSGSGWRGPPRSWP